MKPAMQNPNPANDSVAAFFVLTFLLSVPFYILNGLAYWNVVGGPGMGPFYLAFFTVTPIASASILTFQRRGSRGLKELFGRIFDYRRIERSQWYAAIFLLSPLFYLLSLAWLIMADAPIPPALVPLVTLPAVFPFFFLLAAAEEVGWMGYAFEPMQAQGGALRSALALGVIWGLWHLPFFVYLMPNPVVLCAQLLTLVGARVLLAWIFNNTGKSVFAAILFHAVDNTALVTFPEIKTATPWGAALFCGFVLVAAVGVTWLWGPWTLARYRFAN